MSWTKSPTLLGGDAFLASLPFLARMPSCLCYLATPPRGGTPSQDAKTPIGATPLWRTMTRRSLTAASARPVHILQERCDVSYDRLVYVSWHCPANYNSYDVGFVADGRWAPRPVVRTHLIVAWPRKGVAVQFHDVAAVNVKIAKVALEPWLGWHVKDHWGLGRSKA